MTTRLFVSETSGCHRRFFATPLNLKKPALCCYIRSQAEQLRRLSQRTDNLKAYGKEEKQSATPAQRAAGQRTTKL